jgi:hypothetical protein
MNSVSVLTQEYWEPDHLCKQVNLKVVNFLELSLVKLNPFSLDSDDVKLLLEKIKLQRAIVLS